MPMPREEDDDLFHDEDDVDFDDEQASDDDADDGESEAKTKKKKTVKKKTAKKKTAKKKAAKKAPKKKAKSAPKAEDDGFGAGLEPDGEEAPEDESADEEVADEAAEGDAEADPDADEFGRPKPQPDHLVHLYELGRLKRTLDREFTAEEAHAFADRYSKVSKNYGRKAVAAKKDTQPAKVVD